MKKYLFEIDIVKCDMPISAAVMYFSGQTVEPRQSTKVKLTNETLFNNKKYSLEITDTELIFNGNRFDFINNTLIVNHDGSVNAFAKVKGQSFLDVQYLDRNRVLAHIFYDRSAEELYVLSFTRQRMNDIFIPTIVGKFDYKTKVAFNNFIQMLDYVSFNIQRRWAIKPSEDFNLSIQTNYFLINKDYYFLDSDREIILVKKNKDINLILYPSRFQNDFNFVLNKDDYVINSSMDVSPLFNAKNLKLSISNTGSIEIIPKKFNRILFDGYSVPLEDEHIMIKVIEG